MVDQKIACIHVRRSLISCVACSIFMIISIGATAQEMPPRPVSIYYTQSMSFGAFSLGFSGGTVTIYTTGMRSSTGGVVLLGLGFPFYPAIFTIEGNLGTVIHPLLGPDVTLTGSPSGTLTMHLVSTDPGDPIILSVASPGQVPVRVSGTLYVGTNSANPPGTYNGTFNIMFIQE